MEENILKICKNYCGNGISSDDELMDSKLLTSYDLMELICELEEEFNIEFTKDELQNINNWSTVSNMSKLIESKCN